MSIQFINRLKSIMKDRKITQTELAKRTGIRQSSISDWLNDRYEPKQDKVYIIAKALNVSPAWLLGYDENIPTNEQATNYYLDAETAEYAEMLRTRPEMRMLFSASRGISKEEMQEAVNYIEFIKSRNKKIILLGVVSLIINIIECDIPNVKAISSTGEDEGVHNIYIRKNMSIEDMRKEVAHELLHIINDDFHIDHHVNLIEHMVRRKELTDEVLEEIDFYHHVL